MTVQDDGPPICPGCNQAVMPKDRPVSALKATWHPGCLKCTTCGTTLNVRSLESYENKPYCRAHRPKPTATQTNNRLDIQQATTVPKAAKKEQGVDKSARMTFAPGQVQNPSTTQHGFVPPITSGANSSTRKVQGVNKAERMTFAPNQVSPDDSLNGGMKNLNMRNNTVPNTSKSPPPPPPKQPEPEPEPEPEPQQETTYEQESYEEQQNYQQSYDEQQANQQTYDEQNYEQQGYEQNYEQQGYDQNYDQQGSYQQEAYDQGEVQNYEQQSNEQPVVEEEWS